MRHLSMPAYFVGKCWRATSYAMHGARRARRREKSQTEEPERDFALPCLQGKALPAEDMKVHGAAWGNGRAADTKGGTSIPFQSITIHKIA